MDKCHVFNFTDPTLILLGLILFISIVYLGKRSKEEAWVLGIGTFAFLGLLLGHAWYSILMQVKEVNLIPETSTCLFNFRLSIYFVSFISFG